MRAAALVGNRVSLRAIGEGDWAEIEEWYGEAAAAAYEERTLEELRAGSLFTIGRPDAEPIGLLEYRREDDWLAIAFIALAKAFRGWGYGSEAVRLLEDWAAGEGMAERFRAEVDARNGLGLYFWLRLGYRPVGPEEFGWQAERQAGRMAMVRTTEK